MCYAIHYHVNRIYKKNIIGYGITTSIQGKKAKHSIIKQELRNNANRSVTQDHTRKCHQIARSNYVRTFYLHITFQCQTTIHNIANEKLCQILILLIVLVPIRPFLVNVFVCFDDVEIMQCVSQEKLIKSVLKIHLCTSCYFYLQSEKVSCSCAKKDINS